MSKVAAVLDDILGFRFARSKLFWANDFCCCHNPLQQSAFLHSQVAKPHCDTGCQYTLYGTAIKVHKSFVLMPKLLIRLRKYSLCCAFLRRQLVLKDYVRVSEMCVSRNLKLSTMSTDDPLIEIGMRFSLIFLKSTMIALVFLTFRAKLLSWHHTFNTSTSLLQALSSLSIINPITVVSFVNFRMLLMSYLATQLCVQQGNETPALRHTGPTN